MLSRDEEEDDELVDSIIVPSLPNEFAVAARETPSDEPVCERARAGVWGDGCACVGGWVDVYRLPVSFSLSACLSAFVHARVHSCVGWAWCEPIHTHTHTCTRQRSFPALASSPSFR